MATVECSDAGRRFGGIVGIGSGIAGLNTLPAILLRSGDVASFVFCGAVGLLYAYGVLGGARLFDGHPRGKRDFEIFLWLQVPILQSYVLSYYLASIVSFSVIWHGTKNLDLIFVPLSGWTLSFFSAIPTSGLGINCVPIVIGIVFKVLNKTSRHNDTRAESPI
jgi:hypothetical protein